MTFKDKKIKLKDGTEALFRAPRVEDAHALIDFLRDICSETDFLMRRAEDPFPDVKNEEEWIRDTLLSKNRLALIREIDGEIAGNCEIMFKSLFRVSHRAGIAVGIRKKYWRRGIGTAMLSELEAIARERGGIILMELDVVADNERAWGLYKKMGFELEYIYHDALRRSDGTFTDEYKMVKKL